ncbi:MAG TPA: WXG100 family type VII secretion target [Nocardioides sp.]|nr:WXG100 family type VII secretion target [Nocardioides sp.]
MSYSPEYGQDEGVLSQAAALVDTAKGDFTTLRNKLTGQIADLQGKWGGQGASAFTVLYTAWDEKQKVIEDALNEFSSALTTSEKDNIATDEEQGAGFKGLEGRLGQIK